MRERKTERKDAMRRGGIYFPERLNGSYLDYMEDFLSLAEKVGEEQQINLTK